MKVREEKGEPGCGDSCWLASPIEQIDEWGWSRVRMKVNRSYRGDEMIRIQGGESEKRVGRGSHGCEEGRNGERTGRERTIFANSIQLSLTFQAKIFNFFPSISFRSSCISFHPYFPHSYLSTCAVISKSEFSGLSRDFISPLMSHGLAAINSPVNGSEDISGGKKEKMEVEI